MIKVKYILILFLFLLCQRVQGIEVLRLYVFGSPYEIGKGGIGKDKEEDIQEIKNLGYLLQQKKSFIEIDFEKENILDIKNSKEWSKQKASFFKSTYQGIFVYKNTVIGVKQNNNLGKGEFKYIPDDFLLNYRLNDDLKSIFIIHKLTPNLTFKLEEKYFNQLNEKEEKTNYFICLNFDEKNYFGVGKKDNPLKLQFDLFHQGYKVKLPYSLTDYEDIIFFSLNFKDKYNLFLLQKSGENDNRTATFNINIFDNIKYDFYYSNWMKNYYNQLNYQDKYLGFIEGEISNISRYHSFSFDTKAHSKYYISYGNTTFETNNVGKILTKYYSDFFVGLFAGDRYFIGDLKLKAEQYHFGYEKEVTPQITFLNGYQFIQIRPEGMLNNWSPALFGLGKLDEQTETITYKSLDLGLITLGLKFKTDKYEITYGIAQYVPIGNQKEEGGFTQDNVDKKISKGKYQGGTLNSISVRYYF